MTGTDERSLRERQADEVRTALRQAFVALILEHGGLGFSLHDVAARAGVSDRTLYRHYPSRDALAEAIATEEAAAVELERRGDIAHPGIDHDREWIADAFEVFERHADLMAALRMVRASGTVSTSSARRTQDVRGYIADNAVVDPQALDQLTALIRLVTGADGWARMRQRDLGLDAREAGYAAHWAVQVLLKAAQQSDGPLRPVLDED